MMCRASVAGIVLLCMLFGAAASQDVAKPAPSKEALTLMFDELPDMNALTRVATLGATRYAIIYQSVDPNAGKTGLIDPNALIQGIANQTSGELPIYAMLDFEDPFMDALQKGPDSPDCQRTVKTMVNAIRAVKQAFPSTKWTYYGTPWLPYWLEGGTDWVGAPDSVKRAALERAVAIYAPIVAEEDWISPTIYPKYDPTLLPTMSPSLVVEQGRAWRAAQVGLSKLLGRGKPVIPNVCTWWTPGGRAEFCTVVKPRQFMEDQILPAVAAGATGFALWGAIPYTIDRVTAIDQAKYSKEKNFGTPEWRAAIVKDYFGGVKPEDWAAPTVRQRLVSDMSRTMADAIVNIRSWEKLQTLPP